ncbi:MAG: sigma-70 family RNA polymerase sigma factor [Anaerolineae bacterium]|nr:sigma-70 family RNA polymerase sigma factor [Anaerolineae bacterium]
MQLILRAQAGDRDAFAGLFAQYKNLVYKTAYLLLDNHDEAEDALQEIFVRVYRSLAGFDPHKGAFSTWLYRITFNYCLNERRRRRIPPVSLDEISPGLAGTSPHEFPGERLAEKQAMEQAIQTLSDRQRAVVILRYYWELSYAEISEILEIPLGTVKSRLDLALKTLRKAFSEQESLSGLTPEVEVYP